MNYEDLIRLGGKKTNFDFSNMTEKRLKIFLLLEENPLTLTELHKQAGQSTSMHSFARFLGSMERKGLIVPYSVRDVIYICRADKIKEAEK